MSKIQNFSATRSRLYAGGTYFKSKIVGPLANKIFVKVEDGQFIVGINANVPDWVIKYDGSSQIIFDGAQITVNGNIVSNSNVLKTLENRMVFPGPFIIQPELETYELIIDDSDPQNNGFSISDLRTKLATSKLVSMPERPNEDSTAYGVDTAVLSPFGRVFMSGATGLPIDAQQCDTGPFKHLVRLAGVENLDGTFDNTEQILIWDGPSRNIGKWIPY